jgi:hypothetical protein
MNYTETFDQFASKLGPTDLALYAGAGIILWVIFKDKLSPVQVFLSNLLKNSKVNKTSGDNVVVNSDNIISNIFDTTNKIQSNDIMDKDVFFDLVVSWKQTRDLAVQSGCSKAVEVADQMFPYLSPSVCSKKEEVK